MDYWVPTFYIQICVFKIMAESLNPHGPCQSGQLTVKTPKSRTVNAHSFKQWAIFLTPHSQLVVEAERTDWRCRPGSGLCSSECHCALMAAGLAAVGSGWSRRLGTGLRSHPKLQSFHRALRHILGCLQRPTQGLQLHRKKKKLVCEKKSVLFQSAKMKCLRSSAVALGCAPP